MNFSLCDDGHEEVCYYCRDCPVCEIKRNYDAIESELESAKEKIESLKDTIGEQEDTIIQLNKDVERLQEEQQ